MRLLKPKDEALYAKLVRLAGGDSRIVMAVLSKPSRPTIDLKTVIEEIENRRQPSARAQPTP